MNQDSKNLDVEGGLIEVGSERVIGRPFLKPLYGLPPYQYTDDVAALVTYRADRTALRSVLPSPVVPTPENTVLVAFFICPEVTGIGPHNFTIMTIPVQYKGAVYQYCVYLFTSTDASLACYREGHGYPAVMGQTEVVTVDGRFRARVVRNGQEAISAEGEFGGDLITAFDFPCLMYKEIPSPDGKRADVSQLVASTSIGTNVRLQAGTKGRIKLTGMPGDVLDRLQPIEILGVSCGTLDELYPATIKAI